MTFVELLLILFSFYTYYKSNNLIYIFVNAFVILYLLNVITVVRIFDLQFSPSQDKFESIELVTLSLLIFLIISWFSIGKIELNFDKLYIKNHDNALDYFKGLLIIFYSIYLIYDKGFRLTGGFLDYVGQRDIYEDYIALIFLIFFISSRASKFLIFSFLIISLSYFLAGERMRMFIYLGTIIIYLYSKRLVLIKFGLIFAYCFAEIISLLRSQTDFASHESGAFVSHFGSVTISSLYLGEFTSILSFTEKLKYFFGIFLGNFLPSSLLPSGFDIRSDLFASYTIPGGGWFTSFLLYSSNWFVYICILILLFQIIKYAIKDNSLKAQYFLFVMLITAPRWFMYSPYLIFRFSIYSLLILFFLKAIRNESKTIQE